MNKANSRTPSPVKATFERRNAMHTRIRRAIVAFSAFSVSCMIFCYARFLSDPAAPFYYNNSASVENQLERILAAAAMEDKTVIITTLNEAWAAPGSVFDLFLESFRSGEQTTILLKHLVIVTLDELAHRRCLQLHKHCFLLFSEGLNFSQEAYFMTPLYLKMMWRRIDFLRHILEMGFHFVFSDIDVMWFRNPFPHFHKDADIQIACDRYLGNSINSSILNGGFKHVRSNNRSIEFYRYWFASQGTYPGLHDQDVLNYIKSDSYIKALGLKMRLLDTAYFGGFCEPSRNFNVVCTMHANCCVGMDSKLHDLEVILQDWKHFYSLHPSARRSSMFSWRAPQKCSLSSLRQDEVSNE